MFIMESALANKGRKVGLLRGATSRFASFFYAMFCSVRLKNVFIRTINHSKFRELNLGETERLAIIDISNEVFWKALYALCKAVFPAIRALRYCDSNTPAMDKIYLLTHRTRLAIEKSAESLNDSSLFGSFNLDNLEEELAEVFEEEEGEEEDK